MQIKTFKNRSRRNEHSDRIAQNSGFPPLSIACKRLPFPALVPIVTIVARTSSAFVIQRSLIVQPTTLHLQALWPLWQWKRGEFTLENVSRSENSNENEAIRTVWCILKDSRYCCVILILCFDVGWGFAFQRRHLFMSLCWMESDNFGWKTWC